MGLKTTYGFRVEPQSVDFTLHASITDLISQTLNVAGTDADSKGFGVQSLNPQNRSWVLSRMAFEIDRRPAEYAPYSITTWVSDYNRAMSTRNFILSDSTAFARATTQWAMIDLTSRRPVDLRTVAEHVDALYPEEPPLERAGKLPATEGGSRAEHRVAYSDIDFNRHTNSLRYIALMIDRLPLELLAADRALRIEVNFLHETLYGQTLGIDYLQSGEASHFEITDDGGNAVCRAVFYWK